ncbi:Bug family tripartite tricarboxylate transporter substrate binding protein [Roseomonas marmotae]|uniref:Tripartite tricarboxylate transporter substrate binding protein n=1 Tax=Roseomonas marmotae TaxID=2768161 RepID=A0ABS3KAS5_9PROT|nr:tripartite tricarboxylate transporter substrate binding protein [Roseomonas marmotae]MBO1073461.1 tripartite tricarboxylate transporter substrate binding protein [Roseomonas marmotae]QTI80344.1 tripartite tricarboxylate transporter substrate binding protein [Roseomonas marmotae]
MFIPTRRALLGASLAGLAAPRLARASGYPDRPVTLVVPFGPGGGNDVTARTLGQFLERELGQSFVVQNRPGAGGEIGINAVADAKPDGYTFGILNTPGLVTIPIERKPRWSLDSFTFVAGLVDDPGVIAVHPDSGIRTVADLVAAAKKEEGFTIAAQGLGSTSFLSVRLLEQVAGVRLEPVIYPSLPQGVIALGQKEVRGAAANLGEGQTMSEGKPWQVVGVMAEERSSVAPQVPTFREQGYDVTIGSLRGFVGPKGVPPEITARLGAAIEKVFADPEYIALAQRTQQPLRLLRQEAYDRHLQESDRKFRALWAVKPWV